MNGNRLVCQLTKLSEFSAAVINVVVALIFENFGVVALFVILEQSHDLFRFVSTRLPEEVSLDELLHDEEIP